VEEDFHRADDPLTAEFAANVRLQIWRFAVHAQKPGKRLQCCQHLPWRAQYTKVQVKAVKAGIPIMLLYGVQVVHGDNRITTDQRSVTSPSR